MITVKMIRGVCERVTMRVIVDVLVIVSYVIVINFVVVAGGRDAINWRRGNENVARWWEMTAGHVQSRIRRTYVTT